MTTEEFSKYFIDNIGRATIYNTLTLTNKINGTDYDFVEFLNGIKKYIETLIKEDKFNKDKCYSILYIVQTALTKYTSNINYTKEFIISDFLIDAWKVLNGN